MELKLNISKQGLATTAEVINEEYTLNYGHIFRGLTAYEQAVNGGFQGSKEEFEAYVGGIGKVSEDAKTAANIANIAATNADSATQNANKATANANASASNAAAAAKAARDATDRVEEKIIEAYGAASEARDAAEDARDAIANFEKKYDDFVLKEQGKGLSTNDYTNADKAEVEKVKDKQDTLTLTTKSNGNIVIGNLAGESKEFMPATPSGDPMHYVYLSYYGVTYNEQTNLYTVGYLTDLTADDMRKAFAMYGGGMMSVAYNSWVGSWGDLQSIKSQLPRTTLPVFANGSRVFYDKVHISFCWNELEQISLCYVSPTPIFDNCHKIWQYNSSETIFSFLGMEKLRFIVDPLWCNGTHPLNMFKILPVLEEVRIVNLQGDINFQSTPLLSKKSLLYMIENCAENVAFTITLHPDVYKKCNEEWLEDIDSALGRAESEKITNITLASA